jgi:hypothetical protein
MCIVCIGLAWLALLGEGVYSSTLKPHTKARLRSRLAAAHLYERVLRRGDGANTGPRKVEDQRSKHLQAKYTHAIGERPRRMASLHLYWLVRGPELLALGPLILLYTAAK